MSSFKTLCGPIVLSAILNACIIIMPRSHDDELVQQPTYLTGRVTSEYFQKETETYVFTLNTGKEVRIIECNRDAKALDELISTYDTIKIQMSEQCMMRNCLRDVKIDITPDQLIEINGQKIN